MTITLRQISALDQLNTRLSSLGTRIRVVPVTKGCAAPVHTVSNGRVLPGPARTVEAISQGGGAAVSMTIGVNTIPGRTFVIAPTKSGLQGIVVVVVGAAPRCVRSSSARPDQPFLIPAGPPG
ncbi:MAG: hypothetical protein M3022_09375 [Actinomycetota bacterium]|nr:hypothetical protein [Actinomycetota bacterium]